MTPSSRPQNATPRRISSAATPSPERWAARLCANAGVHDPEPGWVETAAGLGVGFFKAPPGRASFKAPRVASGSSPLATRRTLRNASRGSRRAFASRSEEEASDAAPLRETTRWSIVTGAAAFARRAAVGAPMETTHVVSDSSGEEGALLAVSPSSGARSSMAPSAALARSTRRRADCCLRSLCLRIAASAARWRAPARNAAFGSSPLPAASSRGGREGSREGAGAATSMFDVRARDATCGFGGFGPAEKRSDATTTGTPRARRERDETRSGGAGAERRARGTRRARGGRTGARASAARERVQRAAAMRRDDETGRRTVVPRSGRRETR